MIQNRSVMVLATIGLMSWSMWAVADDTNVRPTPTAPPITNESEMQSLRPASGPPLLREGSQIMQARARIAYHEATNEWRVATMPARDGAPSYTLTLMPSTYLSDAQQIVQTSNQTLVFEISGQVFVYNNRNYLMLSHPARVLAHDDNGEDRSDVPAPAADDGETQPQPRDADAIMRDLERETGPVQRRTSSPPVTQPREGGATNSKLMREGSSIIMRRGKISRDAGGGWVFLFDADATGLADPPMTLLPCLLLHRLERHAQTRGNASVLLSGRVYTYDDRNYLLPSVFQLPRDRTFLSP